MTRDEIISMARASGLSMMLQDETTSGPMWEDELERFARLVREAEREACAKLCEEHPDGLNMMGGAFVTCAAAIRAMGENDARL